MFNLPDTVVINVIQFLDVSVPGASHFNYWGTLICFFGMLSVSINCLYRLITRA